MRSDPQGPGVTVEDPPQAVSTKPSADHASSPVAIGARFWHDGAAVLLVAVAMAGFFLWGRPVWATLALGVAAAASRLVPAWRRPLGFTPLLFAFCLLDLAINSLGVTYPYSNIFILTGLLAVVMLAGISWQEVSFGTVRTGLRLQPALGLAFGLALAILAGYFLVPGLVGGNPTPIHWPWDVVLVLALGYAAFSALMEETIFRGVMLAVARRHVAPWSAVLAQSLVFAALHYRVGFPQRPAGALLAWLWGLGAGWLVLRTGVIYPAYVMHFALVLILFMALYFFG